MGNTSNVRTAVIGVGYLGKYHAQKHAALDNTELIAVVDINRQTAENIANKYNTKALTDYRDLVGKVDAVSIVTPSETHFDIAKFCLKNKINVLVEKPITTNVAEAQQLIDLAEKNNLKLQVGHIERFNPIILATQTYMKALYFIESTRIMPFDLRNNNVSVILDLMIHDIDLIHMLVNSKIENIDAYGACVLTDCIDIANARIKFQNGCVANVNASRISDKLERKMRIFEKNAYLSLNLQEKTATIVNKSMHRVVLDKRTPQLNQPADPLLEEIHNYCCSFFL